MEEIWKNIIENYSVSNLGRVKSLKFNKEKILKQNICLGYCHVKLYHNGQGKIYKVHRLVAEAFIPNPDNLPQINHKDENPRNNFVFVNPDGSVDLEKSNLEWCDAKYNSNYGTRNERMIEKLKGQKRPNISEKLKGIKRPYFYKPVLKIDKDTMEILKEYSSIAEAERDGYCGTSISYCCNGKRKTHKGYRWEYKKPSTLSQRRGKIKIIK